ncbi:MAG: sec-independent protein translocase protein TatB [Gammaproteobacteria bacterium]|jgi:sec-independent protein translocase protein TatB
MFDMGFTEIALIGVVALVVIGPERLPAVARTAGKYFGRLRRFMVNIRADVETELRADELRDIMAKQREELNSLKDVVTGAGKQFEESTKEAISEIETPTNSEDEYDKNWVESISKPTNDEATSTSTDQASDSPDSKNS